MRRVPIAALAALLVVALTPAPAHAAATPAVHRGEPAVGSEWPDVVQVRFPRTWCTGTLVAVDWVLTAAHCGSGAARVVGPRVRADDPTWEADGEAIAHPSMDLALVRLAVPHRYAGRPLALATDADASAWAKDATVRFAGWGETEVTKHPAELRAGEARVGRLQQCGSRSGELCLRDGSSPCYGDSGAPVVGEVDGRRVLVGVVVRSARDCGSTSTATLVAAARGWIDHTLAGSWGRVAGVDRYATAAALADGWRHADVVYVAGDTPADGLAAGPAAAASAAPLLLTSRLRLDAATAAALRRLQPKRIVVVGGTAAVSDAVVDELQAIAPVERRAGTDRFGTAVRLVDGAFRRRTAVAFLVGADDTVGALTVAGVAAVVAAPLLVVDGGAPLRRDAAATLHRLAPAQVVLVGAPGTFGASLRASLPDGAEVLDVGDADRDVRTLALLDRFVPSAPSVLVTGEAAFADALAAIAATTLQPPGPIVVARAGCLPAAVADHIGQRPLTLLGGTAAVSDDVGRRRRC